LFYVPINIESVYNIGYTDEMNSNNKKFKLKLILGITTISLLGLLVVYVVGNTVVRQILYESAYSEEYITAYVTRSLRIISLSFAGVLLALNILTIILMSLITRNMEEIRVAEERLRVIINASPLACWILDETFEITEVNNEAVRLFGLKDSKDYIEHFANLSPEHQPDGRLSRDRIMELQTKCFVEGSVHFEWMHQTLGSKEEIPCEVHIKLFESSNKKYIICFARDLREIKRTFDMVHQLETAAYTDALTGASNRRYLDKTAAEEINSCMNEKKPLSMLMFDVDFFKKVNDTHGHQVGDEVLKILVSRIRHALKKGTVITRFGGEEFIATLPGSSIAIAIKTAERVRTAVERTPFKIKDLKVPVTISVGVTSLREDNTSLHTLVAEADEALYKAKQTGRNKVAFYEP